MKNVILINKYFLLISLFLLLIKCKENIELNKISKDENKFENFYEKIDSIKIKDKVISIEKFYTKNDLDYVFRISKNNIHSLPFESYGLDPSSFSIIKLNEKSFEINIYLGNATCIRYLFITENNNINIVIIEKIITISNNIIPKIEKDTLLLNKNITLLDKNDVKKIKQFTSD